MGRIDSPAPPRLPPRLPARQSAGAWKIVGGVLAVFVAFVAYKLVARGDAEPTGNRHAALATPAAEAITSSSNEALHSERLARALTAIVAPPVSPARGQRTFPPPVPTIESNNSKMNRCLSLGMKALSPAESPAERSPFFMQGMTQFRVSVMNRCNFSFEGRRVSFKITMALGRWSLGTENFGDVTIDGGGRVEKVVSVRCSCTEADAMVTLDFPLDASP